MTACKSCGAKVVWAVSAKTGGRMPLDAEPVENGNVVVDFNHPVPEFTTLRPMEVAVHDGPLYLSHFATCPDQKQWRKK